MSYSVSPPFFPTSKKNRLIPNTKMDEDGIQLNFALESTSASKSSLSNRNLQKKLNQLSKVSGNDSGNGKGWRQRRVQAKLVAHRIKKATSKSHDSKLKSQSSNQNSRRSEQPEKDDSIAIRNQKESKHVTIDENLKAKPRYAKFLKNSQTLTTVKKSLQPEASQLAKKNQPNQNSSNMSSSIFRTNPEIPNVPTTNDIAVISAPKIFPENASFEELGVHKILCHHLSSKMAINKPTNIQRYSLPYLLDSCIEHDYIIKAQTGSGKTLAFLLPIINRLLQAEKEMGSIQLDRKIGTLGLILAPTRELAQQIYNNLEHLLQYTNMGEERFKHWIVSGLVIGGDKKKAEKARIRKGVNILVSTPGRLLDHLKTTQCMKVGQVKWLVLDEADRLLELGFRDTLTEIIDILNKTNATDSLNLNHTSLPKNRQIVLCSATIGGDIKNLAQQALVSPVVITEEGHIDSKIEDTESVTEDKRMATSIPSQLEQKFVLVPAKLRFVTLISYLKRLDAMNSNKNCKIIVFFSSCDSVDYHFMALSEGYKSKGRFESKYAAQNEESDDDHRRVNKLPQQDRLDDKEPIPFIPTLPIYKLHGNLSQQIRSKTTHDFASSKRSILLCTDVAARGLDIPDISHIVQYDVPTDSKDYVHRAGRTARIGKSGSALLFILPSEAEYVGVLRQLGLSISEIPMKEVLSHLVSNQELGELMKKDSRSTKAKIREKEVEFKATNIQMTLERYLLQHPESLELSKKAFTSHIRAYATHPSSLQNIFHVRRLHLGHVAKSFGLREAPGNTSKKKGKGKSQESKKTAEDSAEIVMKRKARALLGSAADEFGDGNALKLSGIKKRRL